MFGPVRITIRCRSVEAGVVRHVFAARDDRFQRRMTAGLDLDDVVVGQFRLDIVALDGDLGKGCDDVEVGDRFGRGQQRPAAAATWPTTRPIDVAFELASVSSAVRTTVSYSLSCGVK